MCELTQRCHSWSLRNMAKRLPLAWRAIKVYPNHNISQLEEYFWRSCLIQASFFQPVTHTSSSIVRPSSSAPLHAAMALVQSSAVLNSITPRPLEYGRPFFPLPLELSV